MPFPSPQAEAGWRRPTVADHRAVAGFSTRPARGRLRAASCRRRPPSPRTPRFFRTHGGVEAADLTTGETLWKMSAPKPVSRRARR